MASSRQPHIYGAEALHYRQGTAVANTETPPTWSPEMAHDVLYPYILDEYMMDVSRWQHATKVAPAVAASAPAAAAAALVFIF